MLNVVIFNGGRGAKNLIPVLLDSESMYVTSIVNAYDDGKSTGEIRDLFRMLGPSDLRKVQELMLPSGSVDSRVIKELFAYRLPVGCQRNEVLAALGRFAVGETSQLLKWELRTPSILSSLRMFVGGFLGDLERLESSVQKKLTFDDCSLMNCIYAGAYQVLGRDFGAVAYSMNKLFQLRGDVLPSNAEDKKLVAIRENGQVLFRESEIVELRSNERIDQLYLVDEYPDREYLNSICLAERRLLLNSLRSSVQITDHAKTAITKADIILYSPGTQHSSLYPTYMTKGVANAILSNTSALKVFICNIGEDYETPKYSASEFVLGAFRYLSTSVSSLSRRSLSDFVDVMLVNNRFRSETEKYVRVDDEELQKLDIQVICDDFESDQNFGTHEGHQILRILREAYEASQL